MFIKKYVEKVLAFAIKKIELKQKLSHKHYCSEGHQGTENWHPVEDLDSLRGKELYWINRLKAWAPNGLNVREGYEAHNLAKYPWRRFLNHVLQLFSLTYYCNYYYCCCCYYYYHTLFYKQRFFQLSLSVAS